MGAGRVSKPGHVVTPARVIADLKRVATTSGSAKVRRKAVAVLRLMSQFTKNQPRTATPNDVRAVRSLWWVFSSGVLTAREKRNRIINLLSSKTFTNPVIRSAILAALASKWGIELFTGTCRRITSRSFSEGTYSPRQRLVCKRDGLGELTACKWVADNPIFGRPFGRNKYPSHDGWMTKQRSGGYTSGSGWSTRRYTSCSFKHTHSLRVISQIAGGTRVTPVVHSAYLSLNKRIAQYIVTRVRYLKALARKRALLKAMIANRKRRLRRQKARLRRIVSRYIRKAMSRRYKRRIARYCRRRPRRCAKLMIGSTAVLVKRRSRMYRTLIKMSWVNPPRR